MEESVPIVERPQIRQTDRPKVSIIVPVYNCQHNDYIQTLVHDIQLQNESSFELIFCDDGSSDDTVVICERCMSVDNRIRLVKNPHKGVSATRNSGIDNARGEWITFVDADDRLMPNFLSSLLDGVTTDIDLVYGGYAIINPNGADLNTYREQLYHGKQQIKKLFSSTSVLYRCSPWAKLFKREIIYKNKIRFDERLPHSEDRLFLYDYLLYVNAIKTCPNIGYLYGNFNVGSLKRKRLPIDIVEYRQCRLTASASELILHFALEGKALYYVDLNLINLAIASLQSIYDEMGLTKQTIARQEEFIHNYFPKSVVMKLVKDVQLNHLMTASGIVDCNKSKLRKLNYKRAIIDFKLLLNNCLRRTPDKNKIRFENYLHYLNS